MLRRTMPNIRATHRGRALKICATVKIHRNNGRFLENYNGERKYVWHQDTEDTIAFTWHIFKERVMHKVRYLDAEAINLQIFHGFEEFNRAIKRLDSGVFFTGVEINHNNATDYLKEPAKELSAPPEKLSKHNRLARKAFPAFTELLIKRQQLRRSGQQFILSLFHVNSN